MVSFHHRVTEKCATALSRHAQQTKQAVTMVAHCIVLVRRLTMQIVPAERFHWYTQIYTSDINHNNNTISKSCRYESNSNKGSLCIHKHVYPKNAQHLGPYSIQKYQFVESQQTLTSVVSSHVPSLIIARSHCRSVCFPNTKVVYFLETARTSPQMYFP